MTFRPGKATDFEHLETFVWQAIFPTFDAPGLTEEQRAENDLTVERARDTVLAALKLPDSRVFTAWDERRRALAGYCILDLGERSYAELVQLIVRRSDWGKGVGEELLKLALAAVGPYRGVQLLVRGYNERAQAFFAKHGFVNTGESAGEYAIDRILMLREAERAVEPRVNIPAVAVEPDDFPTEADEPPFDPVYEELPDFNLTIDNEPVYLSGNHALATEELNEGPLDTEESTLDEEQRSELAAFIARARAKKADPLAKPPSSAPDQTAHGNSLHSASPAAEAATSRHPDIPFEVNYGEPASPPQEKRKRKAPPTFEFVFDAPPAPAEEGIPSHSASPPTEAEETLELKELPDPVTVGELRGELEDRLGERLTTYFGTEGLTRYLSLYKQDDTFPRIRDVALGSLAEWINGHATEHRAIRRRKERVMADLVEYFIVETGAEVHGKLFPQRLLRYQGVDWKTVDLFQLVMDYLDFEREEETVYTDFVAMPTAALKGATKAYLRAGRDERVFFICDQSLLGNGKQGFAFTDSGLYWKNVLQSAGAVTFTTLRSLGVENGHLLIDGQYFDAGSPLNIRIALLLDKLRTMDFRD